MRKWMIISGLLVVLLAFLAWQAPSGWTLKLAQAENPGLSWSASSGSAWRGRAENVYWQGLALGTVEWRILGMDSWSRLETRWGFHGESAQYALNGRISVGGGEIRRIDDMRGHLPAAWVDLNNAMPFVYLTGTFEFDLDRLVLNNSLPVDGAGRVRWLDAGLGGLVSEQLGTLEFNISPAANRQTEALIFKFESLQQADIRAFGSGRIDGNDYAISVRLAVAPDRRDVIALLEPFGQAGADGSIEFQWQGTLFPTQP